MEFVAETPFLHDPDGCALDAGAIEFLFRIPEHAEKQEADSEHEDV
jgi:hypothetical protein